jgi:hypothetical protein
LIKARFRVFGDLFYFCWASTKNSAILGLDPNFVGSNQKSQFCGFFDDADVAFSSYVVIPLSRLLAR